MPNPFLPPEAEDQNNSAITHASSEHVGSPEALQAAAAAETAQENPASASSPAASQNAEQPAGQVQGQHTTPASNSYSNAGQQPYQNPTPSQSSYAHASQQQGYQQPYQVVSPQPKYLQAEQIVVERPNGERHIHALASNTQRILATVIDAAIIAIPSCIIFFIFLVSVIAKSSSYQSHSYDYGYRYHSEFGASTFVGLLVLNFFLSLVLPFIFQCVIPYFQEGQTIGKRIMHIRPVSTSGRYLSKGEITMRQLVGLVLLSSFTGGLTSLISLIMILLTDRHQGIHDRLANSVVINDRPNS